jgi:RNA polymerase sigma-70 factor (ECF subfamily)
MSENNAFRDLIRRVRAGDQQAAAELLRRYEPVIRRTVRVRLVDRRLGRLFDSMDICQSVLGSFFVRAALGEYELDEPAQLLKLLARMVRHKVATQARKQQRLCRDHRRTAASPDAADRAEAGPTPSQQVAGAELLQKFREHLTEDERAVAEQRALGREWADIAAERGGSPEALRKQLTRAVARVARRLGLDEVDHE